VFGPVRERAAVRAEDVESAASGQDVIAAHNAMIDGREPIFGFMPDLIFLQFFSRFISVLHSGAETVD
jgi:hypothetical protein